MSNHPASTAPLENTPASVQVVEAPTAAHYYEILDRAGKRRAGLTVMLDSQQRATRAELCYYERYHALEPVQEEIFDQAVEIVENNYLGNGLSSELAVIDGTPMAQEMVRHSNPDPIYRPDRRTRVWPYAAGYAALVVLLLLLGLLNRTLFRPTVAVDQIADAVPLLVTQSDALPVAEAPVAAGALAAAPPDALQPNTNGLPVSVNANDALAAGMKARIGAGLRSFVRSEPGPEAGEKVGFLEDGATATILGGPTWLPGDTDTIVWWYVETEDGIRGWTPANTSQLMLLEPAE